MKTLLEHRLAAGMAAWLFVLIWASGFVVARGITGLIDPYLFLLVRFICVLLVFGIAMILTRTHLPANGDRWRLVGVGALMQGIYLGPGFWAVSQGLEAGVMSLIGTMQPPLTAVLAWYFFREQISGLTVIGLAIGITGVALAVSPALAGESSATAMSAVAGVGAGASNVVNDGIQAGTGVGVIAAAVLSIGSITAGTLLQKSSIVTVPLLIAITFQTLGAVLVMLIMAIVFGHWIFPFTRESFVYLAYAVFILSIGGFTLLTWLVRTGSATRASSLLLLVPPLAALMSWRLYGESLGVIQISGFALALVGVVVARHRG
jgi:drug/metabolite transporter (DMT)-like permease